MTTFLWVMFWIFLIDCIDRVVWLVRGEAPPRTKLAVGIDLIASIGIFVWIVVLLNK